MDLEKRNNRKLRIISVICFAAMLIMATLIMTGCSLSEPAQGDADAKNEASADIDYSDATVSYLGPEGTYTQEACEAFFENEGTYEPYETVNDAVQALVNEKSDYAVIPIENTIGGAVVDYVDVLETQTEVSVAGEVELPISQNLLVLAESELADIRTVYSHKQGIAQGKAWLEENLPDAEVIEVSSTAEGARKVAEGQDKTCAAIASAGCVDVYGLELLAPDIQQNDKNKTRFYVLSMDEPEDDPSDRLAFIATGTAEELPELLAGIDEQDMDLVTIHDRPLKTELGEYIYLIECRDADYDEYTELTKRSELDFRYLGSFAVH